jgi:hypothetical protein
MWMKTMCTKLQTWTTWVAKYFRCLIVGYLDMKLLQFFTTFYTQSPNVTVEFETYLVGPGFKPQTKDGLFRGCSSFSSVCGGIRVGMNYQKHAQYTRTRTIVCACNNISPRTYDVYSRPFAGCCTESRRTLTPLFSSHQHSQLCLSVYTFVVYGR